MPTERPAVALAHDYLTQRGGAERVVLNLAAAFPGAPLYTSLYEPDATFDAFAGLDVRTTSLNRLAVLRQHHRLGLPLYASVMERLVVDADVAVCSSSGWAHGVTTTGAKLVYCHAPARWLYQTERYLGGRTRSLGAVADALLAPGLRRWDRRAAATARRYLCNSSATAAMVRAAYGIDATVVPPPPALSPVGPQRPVDGVEPGFLLSVARLLPYKNVDVLLHAARAVGRPLVVVGDGPSRRELEALAGPLVTFVGTADDATVRWCYANAAALVAVSYEDYGLTPLEAASFGTPTVALRAGGYLDTVVEGSTGTFVEEPTVTSLRRALDEFAQTSFDPAVLTAHAATFSLDRFVATVQAAVDELAPGR